MLYAYIHLNFELALRVNTNSHHVNGHGPRKEVRVVQRGHEVHGARVDDAGGDEEDHVVVGGRGQQVIRH